MSVTLKLSVTQQTEISNKTEAATECVCVCVCVCIYSTYENKMSLTAANNVVKPFYRDSLELWAIPYQSMWIAKYITLANVTKTMLQKLDSPKQTHKHRYNCCICLTVLGVGLQKVNSITLYNTCAHSSCHPDVILLAQFNKTSFDIQ